MIHDFEWQPGDQCAACGSINTDWGEPIEGARCGDCGASDADE